MPTRLAITSALYAANAGPISGVACAVTASPTFVERVCERVKVPQPIEKTKAVRVGWGRGSHARSHAYANARVLAALIAAMLALVPLSPSAPVTYTATMRVASRHVRRSASAWRMRPKRAERASSATATAAVDAWTSMEDAPGPLSVWTSTETPGTIATLPMDCAHPTTTPYRTRLRMESASGIVCTARPLFSSAAPAKSSGRTFVARRNAKSATGEQAAATSSRAVEGASGSSPSSTPSRQSSRSEQPNSASARSRPTRTSAWAQSTSCAVEAAESAYHAATLGSPSESGPRRNRVRQAHAWHAQSTPVSTRPGWREPRMAQAMAAHSAHAATHAAFPERGAPPTRKSKRATATRPARMVSNVPVRTRHAVRPSAATPNHSASRRFGTYRSSEMDKVSSLRAHRRANPAPPLGYERRPTCILPLT